VLTPPTWHLVTGEYPPDRGGVADYTAVVAGGLADAGCEVQVWTSGTSGPEAWRPGVTVHRVAGRFGPAGLVRLGRELSRFRGPRVIVVQYVPQAFGHRGMNLPFAAWVFLRRIAHRDDVRVMFHEVCTPFAGRNVRRAVLALVQRGMAAIVGRAAEEWYGSVPGWEGYVRPLAGRRARFRWLPVPATVPGGPPLDPSAGETVGHFGTYGSLVTPPLAPALTRLLADRPAVRVELVGRGGERFRDELVRDRPDWIDRVSATGELTATEIADRLRACAVVIQPYPDGVSSRRTSVMAALANGVPVVTTFGFLSEPVWKEEPGVVLADPDRLADAAGRLLDDPRRRAALGRAGWDLYERRFDVRHTVAALLAT
jgi:hypothetical protein